MFDKAWTSIDNIDSSHSDLILGFTVAVRSMPSEPEWTSWIRPIAYWSGARFGLVVLWAQVD